MSRAPLKALPPGRAWTSIGAVEEGGIDEVNQVFGNEFNKLLDELNEALAA